MKSTRFSPLADTPGTCARNKLKKKPHLVLAHSYIPYLAQTPSKKKDSTWTWPTPIWLRYEAKKSEHLAHSLAPLPNKKNCPRYQAKKREKLAHPNLA